MPLMKGKSEKAFKQNVRTEMHAGKPQKQSLAIAYAMKRKGKKMADGGEVDKKPAPSPSPSPGLPSPQAMSDTQASMRKAFKFAEGGSVKSQTKSKEDLRGVHISSYEGLTNRGKKQAHKEILKESYDMPRPRLPGDKPSPYAHGGQIKDNYQPSGKPSVDREFSHEPAEMASGYMMHEVNDVKSNGPAMHEAEKKLNQHAVDMMASTSMSEQDIVDRIMEKRSQDFSGLDRYSEGGRVANQEHGENNNELAGFSPNEFDDLVLRDDLESSSNGENNGDFLGNEQEDEDRKDIVARIMASRRKKDRLPSPA